MINRQAVLKPQDLLVALKIAVNPERTFTFAMLGAELDISSSEAHACVRRSTHSSLLSTSSGSPRVVRAALEEFVLHGLRYSFPATFGPVALGIPTGGYGPVLRPHFVADESAAHVWPDHRGRIRAASLYPLYPSVPAAAHHDHQLYELLSVIDAIRAGTARERELAEIEFRRRIA